MELTKRTLMVLKNFATINTGMYFKPGRKLRTIAEMSSILATADIDTDIETEFYISDLPRFLSVVSLIEDPQLDITSERILIKSGNVNIQYVCDNQEMVVCPPENDVTFPPEDFKFTLTNDMLKNLLKACSVLRMDQVAIIGDGKTLSLRSTVDSARIKDFYELKIGETDKDCKVIISADNLNKLLPASYTLAVGHNPKQGVSKFTGIDVPVTYFVAVNSKSRYE